MLHVPATGPCRKQDDSVHIFKFPTLRSSLKLFLHIRIPWSRKWHYPFRFWNEFCTHFSSPVTRNLRLPHLFLLNSSSWKCWVLGTYREVPHCVILSILQLLSLFDVQILSSPLSSQAFFICFLPQIWQIDIQRLQFCFLFLKRHIRSPLQRGT